MSEPDELAEVRAELQRRGALPKGPATEYQPADNAYLVILAEAVNHLAKSVSEMRVATAKQAADLAAATAAAGPRVRRIERDADGNIVRIIEE